MIVKAMLLVPPSVVVRPFWEFRALRWVASILPPKQILFALLLALCAVPAWATIAIHQQSGQDFKTAGGSGAGTTASLSVTTSAGDTIWAAVAGANSVPTVSDGTNTYTCATNHVASDSANRFCVAPNVGAGTFTVTTNTLDFPTLIVLVWSGGKTSSPLDQQTGATTTISDHLDIGTITETEDGEIVLASLSGLSTSADTIDNGFTSPTPGFKATVASMSYSLSVSYIIETTASTRTPRISVNVSFPTSGSLASYKAQPAPGSLPVGSMLMMGVGK